MFFSGRMDDPNQPYVADLLSIDERICELLLERERIAGLRPGVPSWQQIEAWAIRFDLEAEWLHRVFRSMALRNPDLAPTLPANLRTILPILKTTESQECTFTLTHMMQYENASIVHLEIKHSDARNVNLGHPRLQFAVSPGDYQVRRGRGHGGGGNFHMEFVVTPALPDQFELVKFRLEVSQEQIRIPKSIVLDQPVSFT